MATNINELRNEFIEANDFALLPTEVVSSYLGLSLAWFHAKAVKGNGIPFRKIGHRRMYQKNEVIFWINAHCPKILRAGQY